MSSAIQLEQINSIARLARLQLGESELADYTEQLRDIIGLVDQMNDVDTSAVAPLAHPLDAIQPMRADSVSETDQRELLMANAPAQEAGLFLVPRVIE